MTLALLPLTLLAAALHSDEGPPFGALGLVCVESQAMLARFDGRLVRPN